MKLFPIRQNLPRRLLVATIGLELFGASQTVRAVAQTLPTPANLTRANLIENGGGEAPTLANWASDWSWSGADADLQPVVDAGAAYAGTGAWRIRARNANVTQWRTSPIAVREGQTYRVSFWVRGTGVPRLSAGMRVMPAPWTMLFETSASPLLEWKRVEFIGISSETRADAAIHFSFEGVGELWLDDVRVETITLPQAIPTRRDNLLRNGSFEVPPHTDDWIRRAGLFDAQNGVLDLRNPAHGRASLKFSRRLEGAAFRSAPLELKANCPHVFSAYLRSDKPTRATLSLRTEARVVWEQTFNIGPQWQRFQTSGSSSLSEDPFVSIRHDDGTLWIDGAHLTEGMRAPRFAPARPVEATVLLRGPSKVFVRGELLDAPVYLSSNLLSALKEPLSFGWQLVDLDGRVEARGSGTASAGGETVLRLRPQRLGILTLKVQPRGGAEVVAPFLVVAPRNAALKAASPFGGHFSLGDPAMIVIWRKNLV